MTHSDEEWETLRRERNEAVSQRETMRERGLELKAQLAKHHTNCAPGGGCSVCGAKIPIRVGGVDYV